MRGRLSRVDNQWQIQDTDSGRVYDLHADDCNDLLELEERFDFIESRIAASPLVEYELITQQKMSGLVAYAKLTSESSNRNK